MSDLILGILPILIMWALPLAPMLCAAVATVIESFIKAFHSATNPNRSVRLKGRQPTGPASDPRPCGSRG